MNGWSIVGKCSYLFGTIKAMLDGNQQLLIRHWKSCICHFSDPIGDSFLILLFQNELPALLTHYRSHTCSRGILFSLYK
jgi:hypothetical protein